MFYDDFCFNNQITRGINANVTKTFSDLSPITPLPINIDYLTTLVYAKPLQSEPLKFVLLHMRNTVRNTYCVTHVHHAVSGQSIAFSGRKKRWTGCSAIVQVSQMRENQGTCRTAGASTVYSLYCALN